MKDPQLRHGKNLQNSQTILQKRSIKKSNLSIALF